MATVMAMGFMGWIGQPISMATMVLPIILIAVGTAYTAEFIARRRVCRQLESARRRMLSARAMRTETDRS
jgi:predicted RND superfamily exporter protein